MTMYTRYATFIDNSPPVYDTAAFLNGVQDGIIFAQQNAGDTNPQTGSYTLVIDDAGKVVEMTSSSAMALTVPPNANVAFPIGTKIRVTQVSTGLVTITQGAGVSFLSLGSALALAGQGSTVTLRKRATDIWAIDGDLLGSSTVDSTARASIASHIANGTGAHAASAVSFTPTGTVAASDAQAAIAEVASDAATALSTQVSSLTTSINLKQDASTAATDAELAAHTGLATGAHAATAISFVPAGNIAATNVSTALAELDAEKSKTVLSTNSRSASYTLAASDGVDTVVEFTGASAQTLTVPSNATVPMPVGTVIAIHQYGTGGVTIGFGAPVAVRSRGNLLSLAGVYAEASLRKRLTDEWVLVGDLV